MNYLQDVGMEQECDELNKNVKQVCCPFTWKDSRKQPESRSCFLL